MRIATCLAVGALVLLAPACNKHKPSPEFEEANGAYSTVTAKLGDDAYADDEMTRIESLLGRVPPESSDAKAAAELLQTIGSERKRVAAEAAAHQKALDNALKAPDVPDSPRTPDEPTPAPIADAGVNKRITVGMSMDNVRKVSNDCFGFTQNLRVLKPDGITVDGVVWERRTLDACRDDYPEYPNHMLVFQGDQLIQIVDKGIIRREYPDAGVPGAIPPVPDQPKAEPTVPPAPVTPPGPPDSDNQQRAPPPPLPAPTTPGDDTGPGPSNPNP